jgi:hypothetical protein
MGHRKSNGKDKCGDSSPSTTLRVRMTNKNRMTSVNRQRPMRGSFDSLRSLRMTSVNRQRQGQMRGFFPFDYAQGQNDKQKQDGEQNKQR